VFVARMETRILEEL